MTRPAPTREVLAPLPASISPATEIRGTMLATSYQLMRGAGFEARYREQLPADVAAILPVPSALSWYPMHIALVHYRLMEQLFPDPRDQIANGRRSSELTQNAHIQTLARGLTSMGTIDPAAIVRRAPKFFERLLVGGAVGVWSNGAKDMRVEFHAPPIVGIAYVRNGWQGMFESSLSLFTRRCFVKQDAAFGNEKRMAFDISWV